ncbi:hypothetical protein [Enterococcus avium]|uniref:hypothetical protein n=1 Tax=Enterococcus avium TaxID=33945 RepID=UPI000F5009B6|nr:hypothetical protein [Enterococcus avium]MDT2491651.1 hypothetical protein [Enterococcus avium]ROZ34805.1 hypothetical protein EGX28_15875 [Enterococcus avium]
MKENTEEVEVATALDFYVQQVKECCRCFECASDDQWEQAVITALQDWGNLTCGNWIDDHEINLRVPLSAQCGGCCPNVIRVNLPENWIQTETITVKVRSWLGLETQEIEVDYVFDDYTHDLMIDLTNALDCCNRCKTYDVIIDYTVGTDVIPPELCRWFCAIAKVYMELEAIECKSCGSADSVAIVEVEGTKDLSATIKYLAIKYFQSVIDEYSLCLLKSLKDWTVIA